MYKFSHRLEVSLLYHTVIKLPVQKKLNMFKGSDFLEQVVSRHIINYQRYGATNTKKSK